LQQTQVRLIDKCNSSTELRMRELNDAYHGAFGRDCGKSPQFRAIGAQKQAIANALLRRKAF
jgi:hypothetical protein